MQSSKEQQGDKKFSSMISEKTNKGKQQNVKGQRSLQENQIYKENISQKDGLGKGQQWYGPREAEDIKKR